MIIYVDNKFAIEFSKNPVQHGRSKYIDMKCPFGMINFANLFYYSAYFCYYLWVSLHFLVLFMGLTILFQLIFTFIYSTFSKKISLSTK